MATPRYYRPYLAASDSELSDSDSEASFDLSPKPLQRPSNAGPDISPTPEQANFAALARALQAPAASIVNASGPTFATVEQEIAYGTNQITDKLTYASAEFKDSSGVKIKFEIKDTSTVVVLQSRDRDKTVFAQPTNCQLFLPRVYKNIIGFSVSQINLTSAFFYFRSDKENLEIQIQEKDNILYSTDTINPIALTNPDGSIQYISIIRAIRPGSYNIDDLLTEIQLQLNRTPLFYDFIGGYDQFKAVFKVQGDFSLNFNYPGDNYYDPLTKTFITNPTKQQITSNYFQQQFANQLTYTEDQILVAYYYPVLKETVLDPQTDLSKYSFTYGSFSQDDAINYIIYTFTGLNDQVILSLINQGNNRALLDTYRLQHTFRYSLVNRYICTYDKRNNRVTIKSNTLNTSLTNLLTAQYNIFFAQQLTLYNLTLQQYQAQLNSITNTIAILQSMYEYLQKAFNVFFAVPINQYSISYYTNFNWTVLIRDGINSLAVSTATTTYSNDILQFNRQPPKSYWTNLKGISSIVGGSMEGPPRNMGTTTELFPQSSNYPYNVFYSNIDPTHRFIDSSGNVYTDTRSRSGDIITDVKNTRYTIFQFRSKYRQTLQIETLPRQTNWRYPAWNKANPVRVPISTLFDASYSYITPSPSLLSCISYAVNVNSIPGWSSIAGTSSNYQSNSYSTSRNYWGSNFETLTAADQNGYYYTFQTPQPPSGSNPARYQLQFTLAAPSNTPIQSDMFAFIYHDVGAFYADVSGGRQNNPINYKYNLFVSSGTLSTTLQFTSYINQTYYVIVRSSNATFNKTDYILVPHFSTIGLEVLSTNTDFIPPTYATSSLLDNWHVAQVNDPAFLRLPIQSTLWYGQSPALDISSITTSPVIPPFIGYDLSNVSNDLTDYIPYQALATSTIFPLALTRADPTTNYLFQYTSNSPYNISSQSYFYPNSQNAIYTSNLLQTYIWDSNSQARSTLSRQYKMVQYYGTTYMPLPESSNVNVASTDISPHISPYTIATTSNTPIPGYEYSGSNLILGFGTCGVLFLPPDGVWEMERFTFKTNFITDTPANINEQIQVLGVFLTSEVIDEPLNQINLSNAIAVLLPLTKTVYTSTLQNFGFDAGQGTYYTFESVSTLVTINKNRQTLSGYTQKSKQLITDENSYYSILPFTGFSSIDINNRNISSIINDYATANITCFHNLVGSPIPYPYANQAYPSPQFYDGSTPPVAGRGVVLSTSNENPVYGPPLGYDESVVKYEQSIPYVNSHIHYENYFNIINYPDGFSPWSNVPGLPTRLNAAVPDYMLMQDGSFTLTKYTYYSTLFNVSSPARSFTNYVQTPLTIDQIFPNGENTEFLAFSGNSNGFIFLGASNTYLRFKQYNPRNGVLTEFPRNSNYKLQTTSTLVQQFVFHDTTRWAISAYNPISNSVSLMGDLSYVTTNSTTMFTKTYTNSRWSELQMDPGSPNLYFARSPNGYAPTYSNFTLFTFNSTDTDGYIRTSSGYTINLQGPQTYRQFAVTLNNGNEEILLLSDASANIFFKVNSFNATQLPTISNASIQSSIQVFPYPPVSLFGGARGSKWAIFNDSNVNTSLVYGNRNDSFDSPIVNAVSWQIFFPLMKVQLHKVGITSNTIPDLTGIDYPEWPHVQMFAYSNYQTLQNDIFSEGGKWGLESNYLVSDVDFRGYFFNSYIINVPLLSNFSNTTADQDYYIAIRGYSPTENFQTMTRFYMPNRYDFGFVRFQDLINEVVLASNIPTEFTEEYLQAIRGFNSTFTFSNQNFGIQGYTGSNYSSSNFGEFLSIYRSTFQNYSTTSNLIAGIQVNLQSSINGFVANDLKYILPSSATIRQRYTDSLLFNILWNTNLSSNFRGLDDEWGLGWNLGYAKKDTGYSTIHVGDSFYKIQQDFIYLRLNAEFNINRMDAGGKENYRNGREATGTTNQYYCKLLLTNFGGNSTTFIHNPITFNPPLNRLTRLSFQWVYPSGIIIDNSDAEWNMTVNIIERLELPVLPDKMAFQPADPRTGNPAPLAPGFAAPKIQQESNMQIEREKKNLEEEQDILRKEARQRESSGGALRRK